MAAGKMILPLFSRIVFFKEALEINSMLTERRTINNQRTTYVRKDNCDRSTNTDMVIQSPKLPLPARTILGGQFFMFPGGKGGQPGRGRRPPGRRCHLVARTGDDVFGRQAVAQFQQEASAPIS
jgi:hypothetical protein